MNTYIQGLKFLSVLFLSVILFQGCANDEPVSETITEKPFELYLTDCPFEAEEVNVEIIGVVLEDKDGQKETLTTDSGIYNLLKFTDGINILLAYGDISLDDIKNIYIELGNQNTIVVDGVTSPLQLIQDNIVKIKVDLNRLDQVEFLVDFFACTSIVENANGFFLKPVIKFMGEKESDKELVADLIEGFKKCYQLVFPVSFLDTDGQTLTANDRLELIEILINNEIKDAVFPINLLDLQGEPYQVNSLEEAKLIEDCKLNEEDEDEDEDEEDEENEMQELLNNIDKCYDIVFPISLLDENGNQLDANNIESLLILFESNTIENVVFPIQLIDLGGSTININQAIEVTLLDLDC